MQAAPVMVVQSGVSPMIHYSKGVPAGPLVCPYCKATISTSVNLKAGLLTWLICGGLCLIGCWPCAPISFCVDSTKDTIHSCPNCNVVLGTAPGEFFSRVLFSSFGRQGLYLSIPPFSPAAM
jgi:lipopolysaccharide-induced tumor necrosis factor-alpha factor